MKFETINGTLCRMVEPEPLTDKAQFPCVVRLIQDNTMLGKANKSLIECYPETHANKRICNKLTDDGLYMDGYYTYRYEIIGYPVEEGSHWWALYQIRSGKKVVKEGGGERYVSSLYKNRLFYLNDYGCLVTKNAIGLIDPCSEEEFLDLDKTGWQLYEPQPIDSGRWACYECGVKDSRKEHFPGCSRDKKPKSAYKVRDWVEYEYSDGTLQQAIIEAYSGQPGEQMVYVWHPQTAHSAKTPLQSITRKLSPSEVIVNIGCLSGTVKPSIYDDGAMLTDEFVLFQDSVKYATIPLSMLDTPTREMVESLIKAQGGAE